MTAHTDHIAGQQASFGWVGIVRLGAVQMALGSIILLMTSTLNRVMVVELSLLATVPGLLVGWHYAVQLTRPIWGYTADRGGRRTPFILAGMVVLAVGGAMAASALLLFAHSTPLGLTVSALAFTLVGFGVGAAGTNLLALLAAGTAPARKAGAAALVWIMMIVGFVVTAAVVGQLLEPPTPEAEFSLALLAKIASGVGAVAVSVSVLALWRLEPKGLAPATPSKKATNLKKGFVQALSDVRTDQTAWRFTAFVFLSMLAYSAQDLVLEPFAGMIFAFSPAESTKLSGVQHGGVLVGMITTALVGSLVGKSRARFMMRWAMAGCLLSALAFMILASGAFAGPGWPLRPAVFFLGLANGAFAVGAIGTMMVLASQGASETAREGTRMGVWGAAQAIAFALGCVVGPLIFDVVRRVAGEAAFGFAAVFSIEAAIFAGSGLLAWMIGQSGADQTYKDRLPLLPAEGAMPAE